MANGEREKSINRKINHSIDRQAAMFERQTEALHGQLARGTHPGWIGSSSHRSHTEETQKTQTLIQRDV